MYLRYGDPSWDSAEAADASSTPATSPPSGSSEATDAAHRRAEGPSGSPVNGNGNGYSHRRKAEPAVSNGLHLPTVELHGVQIHAITEAQTIAHVLNELDARRGGVVVTPNLDHLRRAATDLNFGAMVAEADLVVADGMPLVWASRIQGTPLPERVAGSNLISTLSGAAAGRGRSVYLLGGAEGTAEAAARVLTERFPALRIAGAFCPPVGFEDDPKLMADIVAGLATARPDVVYVALGSPKQEKLIARLRPVLPEAWWLGVGVSFSFLCGDVRRAPRWMQCTGLEWVHRLVQEPRRLFKRYVVSGMPFAAALLGRAVLRAVPNRLARRRAARHAAPGNPIQNVPSRLEPPLASENGIGLREPLAALIPTTLTDTTPATPAPMSSALEGGMNLSRLRAMVLLGGSVRPSALGIATGRSVLDLPLDENGSVLNGWLNQATEVARSIGLERLPVRVMVDQTSPEPTSADARYYGTFRVERDLSEYRGTGGVLHDLAKDYADDDLILVANAAQILLDPLASTVAAMQRKGGDVAVVSHEDGTPSGMMLVTCKTLRLIAPAGFVDMKEQALPQIARKFDVRVVKRRRPSGLPIRSLEDYVQALRYHHRRRQGKPGATDPLAEEWASSFSLIEPGATVDPTARVHESVVLRGATVEAGAVLVRAVVCDGGVVRRDKSAVDQFVCAGDTPAATSNGRDRKKALREALKARAERRAAFAAKPGDGAAVH